MGEKIFTYKILYMYLIYYGLYVLIRTVVYNKLRVSYQKTQAYIYVIPMLKLNTVQCHIVYKKVTLVSYGADIVIENRLRVL
jgi:hypothetical protein